MVHRRPQTLDRLTSLRAFAALAVFVFHLDHDGMWAPFPRLVALGQAGITFFFILSGFVLVWAHPDHDTPFRFYRRRFARVYPSHFVMLLVTVIVPTVAVARGVPEAIVSATLTQGWFAPTENLVYGMNGVSWTLSCEAFFSSAARSAAECGSVSDGSR
jgi:peptidoglycan/LPS O-acetylase OafA/YrhL